MRISLTIDFYRDKALYSYVPSLKAGTLLYGMWAPIIGGSVGYPCGI